MFANILICVMKYILETERLLLREFTLADTKFIIELLNTPGWIQYIGDRNIKTEGKAKEYLLNGPIKSYELNGFGLCLVEIAKSKIPIGMCGILKRDHLVSPDIGFAFLPAYMGKGFAFEIANATMKYAKNKLNLPAIFAITVPHNDASIKLLGKIGMKYIKTFSFPGDAEVLLLFGN
jgi:RimJ/RimL family protein N-acetyltransferase